jgi:lambda family phage portal protein
VVQGLAQQVQGWGQRLFDAAQTTRHTLAWSSRLEHVDAFIAKEQVPLVARSRTAYGNNGVVHKFVKMMCRNVVGSTGIGMQAYAGNASYNKAIEQAFSQWGKACDSQKRLSWRALQEQVLRSLLVDGEAFVYFESTPDDFSLTVIDAQRIPATLCSDDTAKVTVVNGVEFDALGRAVGYYMTKKNIPREAYHRYGTPADYTRLDAKNVLHIFRPEFVGQKRGLPATKTCLQVLNQLDKYTYATLVNARNAANKGLILRSTLPVYDSPTSSVVPEGEEPTPQTPMTLSETGEVLILPDGYEPITHNPTYPTGEFPNFRKELLKEVASALDISYANVASDGEGTNFSTLRQFALDERDEYMVLQQVLIEQLCDPLYSQWLNWVMLKGVVSVPASAVNELRNVQWLGRRWAWVDPMKDSMATVTRLKSFTQSFTQAAREQGRDSTDLFKEIARDMETMKEAGIPDALIQRFFDIPVQTIVLDDTPTPSDDTEISF